MKFIAAILLLLSAQAAYAENSCALKRLASVDMRITDGNKLIVQVMMGVQKVPFGIDTRIVRSILYRRTVERLGLPDQLTWEHPLDVDDTPLNHVTKVPSLTFGRIELTGESFVIAPDGADRPGSDGDGEQEAGILGADFLRNYDVEIDPAAGKLYLYSQDHCDGKVVYWARDYDRSDIHLYRNGQIEMDVDLDGQILHALLATGTANSVLEMGTARRRFGIDPDALALSAAEPVADLSGGFLPAYRYGFKSLKLGDLTITNPNIEVAPVRTPWRSRPTHITWDLSPDLLIGMNFLRKMHLYIAYREDRIYYTLL